MGTTEQARPAALQIQGLLDELTASGRERGLQVAAYLEGALAIDAWSGIADPASGRPVSGDTLFHCWSTGKGTTVTAVHLLADRGLIDYDAPIASYWPEWSAHGKGGATIRHALIHSAGVPQLPAGLEIEDLSNWNLMCERIAAEQPLWQAGTRVGYHGYTFGFIVGEIVRRASGQDIASVVRDEIARPLGIEADLFISAPPGSEPRLATAEDGGLDQAKEFLPPDSLFRSVAPPPFDPSAELTNRADFRRAVIPSSGVVTARGIARLYAALAGGGELDGVRLLSRERIELATELQTEALDEAFGIPIRRGLGYFLGGPLGLPPMGGASPLGSRGSAFGHNGSGGSVAFADPEHQFAFALTKNRLSADPPESDTALLVARETRAALGIPE